MPNKIVSKDIDDFLTKSTKEEAATFLGLEDTKAQWGQITGNLSSQSDLVSTLALMGSASQQVTNTAAIALNTAKVGVTDDSVAATSAVTANSAKIGITSDEQDAIQDNTSDIASLTTSKANIASPKFDTTAEIGANYPDDAKLLMTDNGTTVGNKGALVKQNNKLFVGPAEYASHNWVFQIETDGKRVLKSPDNGGIKFGNSTGMLLDYYRFGTFSPKLESGDGTVVQSVYQTRQANYVRIGDLVQVNIYISVTQFDTAWKTSTKDWRITDLPYRAIGNHNMEIRPILGWLDLGNNNITGSLPSGNDYLWVEQFIDGGTTAGQGGNTSRINGNSFVTHPFNFSTGSFRFVITGSYKTNEI